MSHAQLIKTMAQQAKKASHALANRTTEEKNQLLCAMAASIKAHEGEILSANATDVQQAQTSGLLKPLLERLQLDPKRLSDMWKGVLAVAELSDPVGELLEERTLESGIRLQKIRVPIGVIAIIFESRPNVMSDVASLCLKSGNAAILRGGKEALHTNTAIMAAISEALEQQKFDPHTVQLVPITDRQAIGTLVTQNGLIDLVIPRGGEGLINAVVSEATIPVIKHDKGVCHVYVDKSADQEMALAICRDAKCDRPSACNACESILVHSTIASNFVPKLVAILQQNGVEIRGEEKARTISPEIKRASAEDWGKEFLDLIVALKVVESTQEAIDHINTFGSHHSDAIVSEDRAVQQAFTSQVDSAAVYVNASTRFTDGGCFGMGAEIGISTDKLHSRGPMGLSELTTYKYVGIGQGQVRGRPYTP